MVKSTIVSFLWCWIISIWFTVILASCCSFRRRRREMVVDLWSIGLRYKIAFCGMWYRLLHMSIWRGFIRDWIWRQVGRCSCFLFVRRCSWWAWRWAIFIAGRRIVEDMTLRVMRSRSLYPWDSDRCLQNRWSKAKRDGKGCAYLEFA